MRSTRGGIVGAAAIMVAAFVLSRLTGLLRTVAISYRFGTGPELDAYVAAIRVPDLLFQVVVGGAVSSAFIPVLTAYLARKDNAGAWRTVSGLFTLALLGLTPLCFLLMLFAPQVMALVAPGFDPAKRALSAELARILLLSPIFFALGTFATSILNAHQRFMLAALAPTVYNLGIILGALVLARPLGIHGLALGAALGAAGYLLVQLPGLIRCGLVFRPTLGLADAGVRRVGQLMLPRVFGLAVTQLNYLVIVILASPIPGALTALDYAWTLMMLPLGIFAMAISTAVFPTLADQSARDELAAMVGTLVGALRVIFYLTIPATVGLVVMAEPIVRFVLERGEFSAASTALTVYALRFYAIGLLGQAAIEIVTRAFYALEDTRTPVLVAAGAMILNLTLALLLRPGLGYGGLALALSISALVEAALLLGLARRRFGSLDEPRLIGSAAKSLAGALALVALVIPTGWAIAGVLPGNGPVERLAAVVLPIVVGGFAYLATTILLRAEEPLHMRELAQRRMRS